MKPYNIHQRKESNGDHELTNFKCLSPKKNNIELLPIKPNTTIVVLSPRRAARVEVLKAKFGSTIWKAQQKLQKSNNDSNKYEYVVIGATPKTCSILQEQKRASREALDKMINPVFDFNENLDSMKEFERYWSRAHE
ncbi:hypothetical protein Csa_000254, partial [Cucumis sativus]